MKVAGGFLRVVAVLALVQAGVWAQEPSAASKAPTSIRTFYFSNVGQPGDGEAIQFELKSMLGPDAIVALDAGQNAIVVKGTQVVLEEAEKLIKELNRPKKAYRLAFTFTEVDGGKKVGEMHSAIDVVSGMRTTLKNGTKVPVATGSYSSTGAVGTQTQFTYLDVGLNIDVTLDEDAGGARLKSKVEQSSIGESHEIAGVLEPVVRQTVMEGTSLLTMGKPVSLGSLDITGSTRHLEIEVVLEPAK
jgi:type II secretory pathway component GspD/PulD (secretin)